MIRNVTASFIAGVSMVLVNSGHSEALPEPPAATEGWVIVHESVWVSEINRPGHHFNRAMANFRQDKFELAALEIKRAAALLKVESRRSSREGKKHLKAAAHRLRELSKKVKNGKVKSYFVLKESFAGAHLALAISNRILAEKARGKKDTDQIGYELKSALRHLEHTSFWSGYRMSEAYLATQGNLERISQNLIDDLDVDDNEVIAAIEGIGSELDRIIKETDILFE